MTDRVILPANKVYRDWPEDAPGENGKYQCVCHSCGSLFIGNKRRITCRVCAASPNAGEVSEAELEKAAAAAFNSVPWDQMPLPEKVSAVYAIQRALSAIGLKVGG